MAVVRETKPEPDVFDVELELLKLLGRFRWVVDEIDELKAKNRSLSARISRLKTSIQEEGFEGEEGEENSPVFNLKETDLSKLNIPPGFQLLGKFKPTE